MLFDYLTNFTTTSSSTWFGTRGLPQLPLRRHVFGSRGFVVYFVDIDFQLHLRRLLHRCRLGCGSRGFIVYLIDVNSSFVFINMYFVTCDARD
jgi:hypothetical protein